MTKPQHQTVITREAGNPVFQRRSSSMGRGVLAVPPEPVIGLAEGGTRWRGMTSDGRA
jgi:hypothetical protein